MGKFFIGLIIGVIIAGGLAFYLNTKQLQITSRVINAQGESIGATNSSNPVILAPGTRIKEANGTATTGNVNADSYDFYNILPGNKANSSAPNAAANTGNTGIQILYIQVGSFVDADSANDMKAQLALQGIESSIQVERVEGKVVNRVVVGPFKSVSDANNTVNQLSQVGIKSQIIKINR